MTGAAADVKVERIATAFVAVLRAEGPAVSVDRTITYARALADLSLDHRDPVYWAGRATLLGRVEDVPAYDRTFLRFWLRHLGAADPEEIIERSVVHAFDQGDDDVTVPGRPDDIVLYSRQEILRHRDLAECSPQERGEAFQLISRLQVPVPLRPTGRRRRSRRGDRPDIRATVRQSMRTGGDIVRIQRTARTNRPRRVILLADVSGSMDPYARAVLRFCHVLVASGAEVEAFTLGTRLTRLTRQLSVTDPDRALRHAAGAVQDWAGGTRLGETLADFNQTWGGRGLAHGAVLVIVSDGWDRGDPDLLAAQMRRLQLLAARIIWVNPLKGSPGYQPLARGMAAALPYIDALLAGHSVATLEHLLAALRALSADGYGRVSPGSRRSHGRSSGRAGRHRPFATAGAAARRAAP